MMLKPNAGVSSCSLKSARLSESHFSFMDHSQMLACGQSLGETNSETDPIIACVDCRGFLSYADFPLCNLLACILYHHLFYVLFF